MLVLGRTHRESIVIRTKDGDITVKVVGIKPNKVSIGIQAPRTVSIVRKELEERDAEKSK